MTLKITAAALAFAALHGLGAASLVALAPGAAYAQSAQPLTRAEIRADVNELADMLEQHYVFPENARQYAAHLRTQLRAGVYDRLTDPAVFASTLAGELNAVHHDAHLRIGVATGEPDRVRQPRQNAPQESFGNEQWLADGVAYMRINVFTSDDASIARMNDIMERLSSAKTFIFDLRTCRGGALETMNPIFSHLFAQPRELIVMDARTGGEDVLRQNGDDAAATLRPEAAPDGITRNVHWAVPTNPVSPLASARVILLTDITASACEHFSLALQNAGRATLVGGQTRGAGHFGGDQVFGNGRFTIFMPVGRTYPRETGRDWEGTGVTPDRVVAPADALNVVLADLNVPRSAAIDALTPQPQTRVEAVAPPSRRYGIMMEPPQGGEQTILIADVAANEIAARAGVRGGDRIVSLNGTPVSEIPPAEFSTRMRAEHLVLVVEREGQRLTFDMRLG